MPFRKLIKLGLRRPQEQSPAASQSTNNNSQLTNAAVATQHQIRAPVGVVSPSTKSPSVNTTDSLWEKAVQDLNEEDRNDIDFFREDKIAMLGDLLQSVEARKELCLEKRWKYIKHGNVYIIRDQLEKVVMWVNKFKEIGDIVVQYDPGHAALPWAGVRFFLQVVVNDSQTFGAMVEGMELVSNVITRYAIFERLYLQTATGTIAAAKDQLTTALLKLYVAVLKYLAKARSYYNRSTTKRLAMSVLETQESGEDSYMTKISAEMANVDSCARLVDAEYQETMNRALGRIEDTINRSANQLKELHDSLKKSDRQDLFKWLSIIPHKSHHKTMENGWLPNSGLWLLRKDEFTEWTNTSFSSILWLHGIPGSGKSKLTFSVIEHFKKGKAPVPIAYFYCTRSEAETERADPDEILRSILKQLSCMEAENPVRSPVAVAYLDRKRESDAQGTQIEKLSGMECVDLILALLEITPATILIDALDECDPVHRHELLAALERIIQESASLVKVFVSSRDDNDIARQLKHCPNVYIRASDNGEDIKRFVHSEVGQAIKDNRLLSGNVSEELKNRITTTLVEGSQGMFRWVSLQIENLCNSRRIMHEGDVDEELGRLPKTLKESYSFIHKRIEDSGSTSRTIAVRTMIWLLCARRTLRASEMVAAVSTSSQGKPIKLSGNDLLNMCHNMVVLDAELDTFRFAHLSVREYLEGRDDYRLATQHAIASETCLAALTNPKSRLAESGGDAWRSYATLYWIVHYQGIGDERPNSVEDALRGFLFRGSDVSQSFAEWTSGAKGLLGSLGWKDSLREKLTEMSSSPPTPLFLSSCFGIAWILDGLSRSPIVDMNQINDNGNGAIYLAAKWKQDVVARLLVSKGADVNAIGVDGKTALHKATKLGSEELIQILLDIGADISLGESHSGNTALHIAAEGSGQGIMQILLEKAKPDEKNSKGQTPLHVAVQHDNENMVRLLLQQPGVNPDSRDDQGLTALLRACNRGKHKIVQLLLSKGANVDAHDQDGWTALSSAASARDRQMTQILLESGANVNQKDPSGDTVLLKVTSGPSHGGYFQGGGGEAGHTRAKVARVLLDYGADVEAKDQSGRTSLHRAIITDAKALIKLLLERGANVKVTDSTGHTPLDLAIQQGLEETVQLVSSRMGEESNLEKSVAMAKLYNILRVIHVYTDKKSRRYWENQSLARILQSDLETNKLVKELLEKGAHVRITDADGKTMLHWAAELGYKGLAELVLEEGADITAKDSLGRTALDIAIWQGHEAVARVLLEQDAHVKTKDWPAAAALDVVAKHGHEAIARLLLQYVNEASRYEKSLATVHLQIAAADGDESATLLLLDKGADINGKNKDGYTALQLACSHGKVGVVNLLLEKGADVAVEGPNSWTALHEAACNGHEGAVKLLLERGADIEARTEDRHSYIEEKNKSSHRKSINIRAGTALHLAALKGHEAILQLLLLQGSDIGATEHENQRTALDYAASRGHVAAVRLLLEMGADIESGTAKNGTPLLAATISESLETIQLLLDNGANVNAMTSYGRTPLHFAAHSYNSRAKKVVELLLDNGANIDPSGLEATPLQLAARYGHTEMVQLLLERGANWKLVTNDDVRPYNWTSDYSSVKKAKQLIDKWSEM